jgi:hypothetical protein
MQHKEIDMIDHDDKIDESRDPGEPGVGNSANRCITWAGKGKEKYSLAEAAVVLKCPLKWLANAASRGKVAVEKGDGVTGAGHKFILRYVPRAEMARLAAETPWENMRGKGPQKEKAETSPSPPLIRGIKKAAGVADRWKLNSGKAEAAPLPTLPPCPKGVRPRTASELLKMPKDKRDRMLRRSADRAAKEGYPEADAALNGSYCPTTPAGLATGQVVVIGWPTIARLAFGQTVTFDSGVTLIPDDLLHNTAAGILRGIGERFAEVAMKGA